MQDATCYTESGIRSTRSWRERTFVRSKASGKQSYKEVNMLYDILFVASFFVTRAVLPIVVTLVLGGWIAKRIEPRESTGS